MSDINKWVSVEDKPLVSWDKFGWTVNEGVPSEFLAAVPYNDKNQPDKELWWIRHCTIEDRIGLCVVGDDDNESAGWGIKDITHYMPLPSPPNEGEEIKQPIEDKNINTEYYGKEFGNPFEQLVYWATHSGWRYCQGIKGVCGNELILKLSHFNSMVNHILKISKQEFEEIENLKKQLREQIAGAAISNDALLELNRKIKENVIDKAIEKCDEQLKSIEENKAGEVNAQIA